MAYINEIFERLDLQQIVSFLLSGAELVEIDTKPYSQRIEEERKAVYKTIKQKVPKYKEHDRILCKVNALNSTTQDVYMEIGMICGATLISQLLTKPVDLVKKT